MSAVSWINDSVARRITDLAELYRDLHAHPELSFAEHRTAAIAARRAKALGYEVTEGIGGTGVVARLVNGAGPLVLLRADMDALPVLERTGLPYASMAADPDSGEPVMHACGHDMHVVCLLGTLDALASARERWSGTVLAVFQPGEEVGRGARAMVEDGLFERFGKPEVVLAQHVLPIPVGTVATRPGAILSANDSLRITLHGRGGHSSRPEATIDPIVMAAAVVLRLQTIVSRELGAAEQAVITIGTLHAGTKENIIAEQAELGVSVRTYSLELHDRVLAAVRRIVHAEADASGADRPPTIESLMRLPVTVNDPVALDKTRTALRNALGSEQVLEMPAFSASEDVGILAEAAGAPLSFWFFGGEDPAKVAAAQQNGTVDQDIPMNHSPNFAPLAEPTIGHGVTAFTAAALAWLDTGRTSGDMP
ncbi:amidohydrolase [Nocardia sp. SYP-A9097]|uniref:amidohydrolase n=1 Tax=Nocardia sp. SYP-A9097 TaxID=2663237 RepID=UPI00129A5424|nr:amidohydrolase [Nocardia sp. SYP-A9097]MRH89723.1 amidohydrolase [Nocardia sp. SYP-A9097]